MADIIHNLSVGGTSRPLGTVHYIEGTGTTAGTWLGSDPSISAYYDGLTIAYKVNIAGASTTTLNINSLGAKTVRRNASNVTTHYPVNSIVHLTYTTIGSTSYWQCADYDADADKKTTAGNTSSKIFLVGATSQSTSGVTTYSHDTAYVGTDGCLYSGGAKVLTAHQSLSGKSDVGHTHTVTHTPEGTVTFTGSTATTSASSNSTVASSTHTHTVTSTGSYTPEGSVSAPTFTGSAATSGGPSATTSVASSGHTHTVSASIANNCMTISSTSGTPSATATVPTYNHTHSVTAKGSNSAPAFTGTAATISVSGTTATPSATTNVAKASHTHTVTANGTATFAGTEATTTTSSDN